jgi:hypothetical protein
MIFISQLQKDLKGNYLIYLMTGIINEEWRSIDGYINYQVSNIGRVRNVKFKECRMLKQCVNNRGYLYVCLCQANERKTHLVHRLVAHEFIENPDEKESVDHIDHNIENNCINNLRWVSTSENGMNRKKQSSTSSKYKGVTWNKNMQAWRAYMSIDKKQRVLGRFDNEKDAARAYNDAATHHYGEHALLNEISDEEEEDDDDDEVDDDDDL